ncbi:uncharacterized protein ACIQIH_013301 isoform 1-T3 [Cyanocitta cristata]
MFRHLLTTNKAGSGVRRGARVAALTRCSHRFTALRGSVLWTERPRHRPLSPLAPAPAQLYRRLPFERGRSADGDLTVLASRVPPDPREGPGTSKPGPLEPPAAGQRCPRPGSGCGGRRRGWGRGASPGGRYGAGGVSPGPCRPRGHGRPAGAPRRRRPAPGGENAAARGRYRPHPLPAVPALPSVPGHSLPSFPAPQRHPSKCGKYFGFSRRRTKKQQLSLRLDQMNTDLTSLFKNPTAHARKRYCASVKYKVLSITIIAAIMI